MHLMGRAIGLLYKVLNMRLAALEIAVDVPLPKRGIKVSSNDAKFDSRREEKAAGSV